MAGVKTTKVTVTMKNELLARCDEEAESLGMNRSAFVAFCVSQYFKTEEAKELLEKSISMYEQAKAMYDAQGNTYYANLYGNE